jgi:hypothetical protein
VKPQPWPPPPAELVELASQRPCSKCGLPSQWASRRARTKGLHPGCAGPPAAVTGQQLRRTIALVQSILPVADFGREGQGRFAYPPTDHYRADRPFVAPPAPYPCAVCGAAEVIHWLPPHDVWRCWEHGPLSHPVRSWEMRGGDPLPAPRPVPPTKEITMQTTYTGVLWTCDACGREHTAQDGKPPLGYSGNVLHTTTLQQDSAVWEWYACGDRCAGKAVRGARARLDLEADTQAGAAPQPPPAAPLGSPSSVTGPSS